MLNVKLAHMPNCIRPKVELLLDQRILFSDFCEKNCFMAVPDSLLLFCTAYRIKIPAALTNKITHLLRLLFRLQAGVDSLVRRVHLTITAKLAQLVDCGYEPYCVHVGLSLYLLAFIAYFRYNMLLNLNTYLAPGD